MPRTVRISADGTAGIGGRNRPQPRAATEGSPYKCCSEPSNAAGSPSYSG